MAFFLFFTLRHKYLHVDHAIITLNVITLRRYYMYHIPKILQMVENIEVTIPLFFRLRNFLS